MRREGLEVTDDVSIIEALGKPVQITAGSYTNIKVTWGLYWMVYFAILFIIGGRYCKRWVH